MGLKICLEQQGGGQQGVELCSVGGALGQGGQVALKPHRFPRKGKACTVAQRLLWRS